MTLYKCVQLCKETSEHVTSYLTNTGGGGYS